MKRPQIVLVPYPAQGHITPMLHLGGVLHSHGFDSILAIPDFIHRRISSQTDHPTDARVRFSSIPSGVKDDNRDFFVTDGAMENYMPSHFERILKGLQLEGRVVCVVVDLLSSWAIVVAARCGILTAGFWPAMLATYRVISAIPELIHKGFISESGIPVYKHNHQDYQEAAEEELPLQTKSSLRAKDLPWLVGNSSSQKSRFKFWLRTLNRAKTLQLLLVNSFPEEDGQPDIEPSNNSPQIVQIGTLLFNNNKNNIHPTMWVEDTSCIEWLEKQSPQSVIYISFGSWVSPIGPEKVAKLALALEATKRPFLWVLKNGDAWRDGLPDGFLKRTAKHGKVIEWGPQEAVLAHEAIGCYITHCGWNSIIEGIRYGKRLICYPISGDQFVNCNFIVSVWRIGHRPDWLEQSAIEESIERVMEGVEGKYIQENVLKLKERVMGDEGSTRAEANLQLFLNVIKGDQKLHGNISYCGL